LGRLELADEESSAAAVVEHLTRLRSEYVERLPAELAVLKALAIRLHSSEIDRARLNELRNRLRQLASSGGTFGLKTLSLAALTLEQRINGWLSGPLTNVRPLALRALEQDLSRLNETVTDDDQALAAAGPPTVGSPVSGPSRRVWLIEDDTSLGRELIRQIDSFGYQARLFPRISDAETAAQTERPDMLIMDVTCAQEEEKAAEILSSRQLSLRALGCPLLFVSAYDDFQSRVRAAQLGASGYFLKPLDVPRLVNRMVEIFEQQLAPPQRVLIVDGDRALAAHYHSVLLNAGIEAEVLDQPAAIIEKVTSFRPELVLMDLHMADISGPNLAAVIRQHDSWATVPIVYLSAETDLGRQIEAMGHDADDFLTTAITDAHLVAAVHARIERARQLDAQISRDSLTGLLKHASIKEAAENEVNRSRHSGKPVTLAMLDIDDFKSVNDVYGHAVGDAVISSAAMVLRQRLRRSDIVGRYGGDEFVAILPECSAPDAQLLLDDIRLRFSSVRFHHGGRDFGCTLSAGLACSSQYPESNGAELLVIADETLYSAKRGGRNQIRAAVAVGGQKSNRP